MEYLIFVILQTANINMIRLVKRVLIIIFYISYLPRMEEQITVPITVTFQP